MFDRLYAKGVIKTNDYINVFYATLPRRCHGASVLNPDGGLTVFLDHRDPPDVQMEGYFHEVEHYEAGDFENIPDKNVGFIENRAHKKRL